jgi:hypothetical protein
MAPILLALLLQSASATEPFPASTTRAEIHEAGTGQRVPLYRYERVERAQPDGVRREDSVFTDLSGTVVYTEKVTSREGHLLEYEWNHVQLGQTGTVKVRDRKIRYALDERGRKRESTGDAAENLVLGPTMLEYLRIHWAELLSGKAIPVRVSVPDRMDDFGFKFVKLSEEPTARGPIVHVQLQPTSVFVSLVVDPISFVFTKEGRLLRMRGISLLKVRRGNEWKDLMAETVFE